MNSCEAIEKMKERHPKTCTLVNGRLQGGFNDHENPDGIAFDMAIEALEKQMAVKPNYEADGYSDGELVYDYAECPVCGKDYEYEMNDWGCNYCSNCGQKLDWSDTECD